MSSLDPPRSKTEGNTDSPQSGAARKRTNRRFHQRIAVNTQLFLCCDDRKGGRRRIRAHAVDVSKSGILIQAEEAVTAGTVVYLQNADFHAVGRASVRHCTQKGLKYSIGLYVPDPLVRVL
jgi:hypothetical protein